MTSNALVDWNAKRASRIALAWQMHATVTSSSTPTWHTDDALAVVLQRMATEFQGYCRSLHDEASEILGLHTAKGNPSLEDLLRRLLTSQRDLDRGNANVNAIAKDFSRFGFTFWPTLTKADSRAGVWQRELGKLIEMRNCVAHDNEAKLQALAREGYVLDPPTLQKWEKVLNGIAVLMDDVVGLSLGALLRIPRPW
ncbi:hypothetical protein [Streptomyces sp. NPDC050355]|uniref:hypothetical protein n=1 Tax=Streptomyces sp. NPDC050355 TaxID=3365609 RepID=UPI003788AAEA